MKQESRGVFIGPSRVQEFHVLFVFPDFYPITAQYWYRQCKQHSLQTVNRSPNHISYKAAATVTVQWRRRGGSGGATYTSSDHRWNPGTHEFKDAHKEIANVQQIKPVRARVNSGRRYPNNGSLATSPTVNKGSNAQSAISVQMTGMRVDDKQHHQLI